MWMLDLCSGLGGASEAFIQSGIWEVVRIENNPILQGVPGTSDLDVLEWMDWLPELIGQKGRPCLVWASPPCLEFSQAYSAPHPKARREGREFEPNMSIVEACIDIIQYAGPTYWVIENVAGACPWFLPELGKHQQKIGFFFLWGTFPRINTPEGWKPKVGKTQDWNIGDPLRANRRALIPLEVSQALLDAISAQSTLADWA